MIMIETRRGLTILFSALVAVGALAVWPFVPVYVWPCLVPLFVLFGGAALLGILGAGKNTIT